MSINEKILKEIKAKISKELKETGNVSSVLNMENMEKYLLEYLSKIDAIEIANRCNGSLDEAIDAIEMLQRSHELRKMVLMLD